MLTQHYLQSLPGGPLSFQVASGQWVPQMSVKITGKSLKECLSNKVYNMKHNDLDVRSNDGWLRFVYCYEPNTYRCHIYAYATWTPSRQCYQCLGLEQKNVLYANVFCIYILHSKVFS